MTNRNDWTRNRAPDDSHSGTLGERLRLTTLEERIRAQHRYLVLGIGEIGRQVARSVYKCTSFFGAHGTAALYGAAFTCSGSDLLDLTDLRGGGTGQAIGSLESGTRRGLHVSDLPNVLRELIRCALQESEGSFPQPDTVLFVDVVYDLGAGELRNAVEFVPNAVAEETGRSDLSLFLVTDRRLRVTGDETSPAQALVAATAFQRQGYHRVYCVDCQDTRRIWLPDVSILVERVAQFIAARCSPILSFHIRSGELSSPGRVMPEHLVQGSFGVAMLGGGLGEVERIVRHLVAEEMGASRSAAPAEDGLVDSLARETANWLLDHSDASQDEIKSRLRASLGRLADGVPWRELVVRIRSFLLRLVDELERCTGAFAFQLRRYQTDRAMNQVIARTYELGGGPGAAKGETGGAVTLGPKSESPDSEPSSAVRSVAGGASSGMTQRGADTKLTRRALCLPGLVSRKLAATVVAAAALVATASVWVPVLWASGHAAIGMILAAMAGILLSAGATWLEWGRGPYLVQLKPGTRYPYVRVRRRYAHWLGAVIALAGSLLLVWSARVPSLLNFVPLALSLPVIGPLRLHHVFVPHTLDVWSPPIWVSVGCLLVLAGVGTRLLWSDRAADGGSSSSAFGWRLPWLVGSLAAGVGLGVTSWECWVATRWYVSWFQPVYAREIALEVVGVLLQVAGVWVAAYRPVHVLYEPRKPAPPPPFRHTRRPCTDAVVAWARNLAAPEPAPVAMPARSQSIFDLICPGWAEQIADACLRELRGIRGRDVGERWVEDLVGALGADHPPTCLEEVLANSAVSSYLQGDYRPWLIRELLERGRPLRLAADAVVPLQWPPGYFHPHRDTLLLVAPPKIVRIELHQADASHRQALIGFLRDVAVADTPVYAVRFAQGAQKARSPSPRRQVRANDLNV